MDELERGISISMTGEARAAALALFLGQIGKWEVALPPVEPLVLDFGLGDFARIGLIEYWIANETAAGYCGKYLFLFDGQSCPTHHHVTKTETFFVVKGKMGVRYAGADRMLQAGDVLLVESSVDHGMTADGPCLFLELSSPCSIDDNCFLDSAIPIGRNARR